MNYRLSVYLLAVIFFITDACNTEQRPEGAKEAVERMKSMQIKRVTGPQVVTIVEDWGERIVKQAQAALESALVNPGAEVSSVCLLKNLPKVDTLKKMYAVEIRLLGAKDMKNPKLSSKEQESMKTYLNNAEHRQLSTPAVQKLGDSVLIYNVSVSKESIICQKCFPDNATFPSVWHVTFRKSEVIRKVNTKSLEKKRKVG
ncbi:MAG: hypothetical protein U0X91_14820 [Spirosomataceae bacterium]